MAPCPSCVVGPLEVDLHTELDLTRALCALNQAHRTTQARVRTIQNRRIRQVDGLSSELNVESLCYMEKLREAEVEGMKSWPANSAIAAGAECSWSRRSVAIPVEPLIPAERRVLFAVDVGRSDTVGPRAA